MIKLRSHFATAIFVLITTNITVYCNNLLKQYSPQFAINNCVQFTETNERFLSIALDSSMLQDGLNNFDTSNSKLQLLTAALQPAYFRIGGNMADMLLFVARNKTNRFSNRFINAINFTLSGHDWLELNRFTKEAGMEILFDLNALIRHKNGSWNYHNANRMLQFSDKHNLSVIWELGNEPDAFEKKFNYSVNATQLAKDFEMLKNLLLKSRNYQSAILAGPDITRPKLNKRASQNFLENFLKTAGNFINVVTWHQYYFNGRNVTVNDFLDPKQFDILEYQINRVQEIINSSGFDLPSWIGETSSAYGGGAPGLSDRFVASFNWLDKLGLSAKLGVDVVVRQSIVGGDYALLDERYEPNPDYWISLMYKRLVGRKSFDCSLNLEYIRIYCALGKQKGSVIVFGMNMLLNEWKINLAQSFKRVNQYEFTGQLTEKKIYLNGKLLQLDPNENMPILAPKELQHPKTLTMQPTALYFWEIPLNFDCT